MGSDADPKMEALDALDAEIRRLVKIGERYPLPQHGTLEEAVKAALKAWRDPARLRLFTREETETGTALPDRTCFVFDVRRLLAQRPRLQRLAAELYYCTPRPVWAADHTGPLCGYTCQEHYGNREVAREMRLRGTPQVTAQRVGAFKRYAVEGIVRRLWPEEVARRALEAEARRNLDDAIYWD